MFEPIIIAQGGNIMSGIAEATEMTKLAVCLIASMELKRRVSFDELEDIYASGLYPSINKEINAFLKKLHPTD